LISKKKFVFNILLLLVSKYDAHTVPPGRDDVEAMAQCQEVAVGSLHILIGSFVWQFN